MFELAKLLPESQCLTGLSGKRDEVLRELLQPLVDLGVVSDAGAVMQALISREDQITTAVGNLVAIPHARSHAVSRLALAVGLTAESVKFCDGQGGGQDVRLIFLIVIPAFAPVSHMAMLQHVAKFAHNLKKVEKALECERPTALAKYLWKYKGN